MLLDSTNSSVRQIIRESEEKNRPIKNYLKDLSEKGIDFIREKEVEFNVDLQFLLTYGVAIPPIAKMFSEFYQFKFPELTQKDIDFLVISIIAVIFYESKDYIKEIYDNLVEKGLEDKFEEGKKFLRRKNSQFETFFSKFGVGVKNYINIIRFSALAPLLTIIHDMYNAGEINFNDILKIFSGILIWFSLSGAGDFLKEFFSNIVKSSRKDNR